MECLSAITGIRNEYEAALTEAGANSRHDPTRETADKGSVQIYGGIKFVFNPRALTVGNRMCPMWVPEHAALAYEIEAELGEIPGYRVGGRSYRLLRPALQYAVNWEASALQIGQERGRRVRGGNEGNSTG